MGRWPVTCTRPGIDPPRHRPGRRLRHHRDVLRKYWRITKTEYGDQRSVHAFVDPATGDVYKAAGWKSPAKGVRYNLLDQASYEAMMARLDPFGAYLYK